MMRFVLPALLVCYAVFSREARACTCGGGGDLDSAFRDSDVVFIGTVLRADVEEGDDFPSRAIFLSVDDAFKGTRAATVVVKTGFGGGDCGFRFREGRQYLVYAYRNKKGDLFTNICTATTRIGWATPHLRWLKARRNPAIER